LEETARATIAGGIWLAGAAGQGMAAAVSDAADLSQKRIFVSQFIHETNTFHPIRITRFNISVPKPGDAPFLHGWKPGGPRLIAGVSASPLGGGTIDGPACRDAIARIAQSAREAMPFDAVFLHLHGAMYAEGVGSAETALIEELRKVVGRTVPIAAYFDLHGNIPARMGSAADILVGYKTAPHVDQFETGLRTAHLLYDTLRGKIKPVGYVLPLPLVLPGEKGMTTIEPLRSLVEEARRLEREGVSGHAAKILAATIFVGCAVTDSPDTGMSVMITADGSRAAARAAAIHLAKRIWAARREFSFGCETADLEEGVTRALQAKEKTVFLTDSGDNVTAAAPGDLPVMLRHLVERKAPSAVVAGINDEAAVRRCFEAGEGRQLRLEMGATVEKRFGPPLAAEVQVVRLVPAAPRMAVVRIGGVEAVLASSPSAFSDLAEFRRCSIDPLRYKLVVVKQGYLFPSPSRIAPRHILLFTPGCSDVRIERLPYRRRRKPAYPFEPDTVFDAEKAP
jgi:microcystin degradation protein MlrC